MVDAALNTVAGGCGWLTTARPCCARSCPPVAVRACAAAPRPAGPNIQENFGPPGPIRTFQDLLTSAHDEALFEYYFDGAAGASSMPASARRTAARQARHLSATPSPDGEYLLVTQDQAAVLAAPAL